MIFKNTEKVVKTATIGIVIYLLCFGVAMAFFPIRPFWNDEWRLIYNLKFKNVSQLWGTLDLLQQCPRVYLTILKKITSFFDYSYTSIRMPALVISIFSIIFIFHLRKKILSGIPVFSFLFILILVSSQTFTDYMTQVKQYEMELLLCLLALWQLATLLEVREEGPRNKYKYLLLCFTFLVAPFFSYTYPIAVTPIFLVIIFNSIVALKNKQQNKGKFLFAVYFPLVLVFVSILIFYFIDVKQLMADDRMYQSYRRMLGNAKGERHLLENFWNLFALVGSGFLFEIIFGIIGLASFFYGIYRLATTNKNNYTKEDLFKLYAVLLLVVTLFLFVADKLLGDVARLTAYTVPSIAILIVTFFDDIKNKYYYIKPANILAGILFIGLFGNMLSTCINTFTHPAYANKIKTYTNTSAALKQARLTKIPILITDGVRGVPIEEQAPVPGKITSNNITPRQIAGADTLCAEVVLKINPEYKVWDTIPIYQIPDMKWTKEYMQQLPANIRSAIAGDGINFITLTR